MFPVCRRRSPIIAESITSSASTELHRDKGYHFTASCSTAEHIRVPSKCQQDLYGVSYDFPVREVLADRPSSVALSDLEQNHPKEKVGANVELVNGVSHMGFLSHARWESVRLCLILCLFSIGSQRESYCQLPVFFPANPVPECQGQQYPLNQCGLVVSDCQINSYTSTFWSRIVGTRSFRIRGVFR